MFFFHYECSVQDGGADCLQRTVRNAASVTWYNSQTIRRYLPEDQPHEKVLQNASNDEVSGKHIVFHYVFHKEFYNVQNNGGWHDSVSLLLANDKAGAVRRNPKIGPSGQELKYELDITVGFARYLFFFFA